MKDNWDLTSKDELTQLIKRHGINSWYDLTLHVKSLPYGRNVNRSDVSLVWKEQKGTCSSKHAFLKHVADLNNLPNIELILCMYKMNSINTAKIGSVLSDNQLNYIPEAHCYIKINEERFDYTSINSDFSKIKSDILLEKDIEPHQVADFKVQFHKSYLKDWIVDRCIPLNFERIWEIREQCIANLSSYFL
ncbi:hypothetical protein [Winogradskyella flava]|uniref:hypothetical protein n=1 Tax=Winogradskyella flava TaxID=1884876 RepID=UPI002490F8D5|nr:hypothetical protein [Winogradskyella flava]